VTGANATTVLVRRVKQGVAEWFRLQIKEKAWRGLREHSLAGWNIGTPPHGYAAERVPHPVPYKAAQGRTKTRLDPPRAPAVAAIFTWRVLDRLGGHAIAQRLVASPHNYPPPIKAGVWTEAAVYAILRPAAPAVTALRSHVLARFTELEDERAAINTQLADLTKTDPGPGDPALLDALPLLVR
jgi:hypothetical protein